MTAMNIETLTGPELVTVYNRALGEPKVSRFASREVGIKRVQAMLKANNYTEADLPRLLGSFDLTADASEVEDATDAAVAKLNVSAKLKAQAKTIAAEAEAETEEKAEAEAETETETEEKVSAKKDLPREGTKRRALIDMALKGATHKEMREALGWKSCLVTLRRVADQYGFDVTKEKTEAGTKFKLAKR